MIIKISRLLLLMMLPAIASASDVVLKDEVAQKDVVALQLNAQVGEVEIRGIKSDRVSWRVELEPQKEGWFTSTDDIRKKMGEIKVRSTIDNAILQLDLDYPEGLDSGDVKHRWHLEVPAAFAVNVKQDVDDLNIADVQGGVNGKLGTGNAKVSVPAGSVSVEVGTGNASVVSATSSVGTIEIHSGLGNASAKISNKKLAPKRHGLKAVLNHAGNGDDDYRISVGTGNAELVIKD